MHKAGIQSLLCLIPKLHHTSFLQHLCVESGWKPKVSKDLELYCPCTLMCYLCDLSIYVFLVEQSDLEITPW